MNSNVITLEARQLVDDISRHIRQVREIVELVAESLDDNRIDALYGASELCTKANEMCGDLESVLPCPEGNGKEKSEVLLDGEPVELKSELVALLRDTVHGLENTLLPARGLLTEIEAQREADH